MKPAAIYAFVEWTPGCAGPRFGPVIVDDHLIRLPGTDWTVWRDGVLRGSGFPVAGLDLFTAPELAELADRYLEGGVAGEKLREAHAEAMDLARQAAASIAASPLFREAVTWQNPDAAAIALREKKQLLTSRDRDKQRGRDDTISRYWQRYCGKNDTIGFFGPVCWVALDPDEPGIRVRTGSELLRARRARYEFWTVQAYADHVAADPAVRPWLPVGVPPDVMVDGCYALRAGAAPQRLTAAEAEVLARCDGRRAAIEVGEPAILDGLVERGVLWWGVDLPQRPDADEVLRSVLSAIPDPAVRERALSGLRRLDERLADVGAAAGDADRLAVAARALDAEFAEVTGESVSRSPGQMYAGRRLFYEDTQRDAEVVFGSVLLAALAGPFGRVVLPAARWLTAEVAAAYRAAFLSLYRGLAEPDGAGVPLDRFWLAAQPLFSDEKLPVDDVVARFAACWSELFGLYRLAPGTRQVSASSAELAEHAAALFAAPAPGWAMARIHSPDLHICASSPQALSRGDFTLVLGEMHAAWVALDTAVFLDWHPDPGRLLAALRADVGPQVRPAYPDWCPPFTARISTVLDCEDDLLAFSAVPGLDSSRLLPVMGCTVTQEAGELVVTSIDGRRFELFDVFAIPISFLTSELFEPAAAAVHTPRLTLDRLVVVRETWRSTIGESGLAVPGRLDEYLAARRFRRMLGLPERVFVKVKTEIKPVYVDWTSPRYVSALCSMLRSAEKRSGQDTELVITEMLPGPEQAWLPGPDGERYCSELRIQMRDPIPGRAQRQGRGHGQSGGLPPGRMVAGRHVP